MAALCKGRYRARIAQDGKDVIAAQRLRALAFLDGAVHDDSILDRDGFDDICTHVLVEEVAGERLDPPRPGDDSLERTPCVLCPPFAAERRCGYRAQLFGTVLRAFGAQGVRGADGGNGAVLHPSRSA